MLGLHYVPGSHGSHGSQKRSSPWCFSHFCLCVQVLLSPATFSHGLSRSAVTAEARRRATVCHGWFYVSSRSATFCWDLSRFVTLRSSPAMSIKFCQGFLQWNVFEPQYAHGIKRRSTKLRQSLYYAPLIMAKTSLHVMAMKNPISYLYNC